MWERIGGLINLSGDACKKRWRGLRDTYKRRKRAAQLASGSGAPSPAKKWKYMDLMNFLDNYKDSRPTTGNVVDDQIDYLFDCSSSTVLSEDVSALIMDESALITDESNDVNEARPKKYSKKQTDAEVTSVFKEVMKECADTVKQLAAATNINDEDRDSTLMLFKSLATKISEAHLPQDVVRRIESKVMNLVYDELAQNCIT